MFYIYILYSETFDKYYVGYTDNPQKRLIEHNEISINSYTSRYRPWCLVGQFEVGENRGLAMKVERHIKQQKSKSYIKDMLKRDSISQIIERFSSVG